MAELLRSRLVDLLAAPAILNPTFDGSLAIGGADADVVVQYTVLELKTTRQDRFERVDHIYQLLGYALLDYSNAYEIEHIAVYLARRGVLVSWPVAELLERYSATPSWMTLQQQFRDAVARISAEA
jgi:hypothetical protein